MLSKRTSLPLVLLTLAGGAAHAQVSTSQYASMRIDRFQLDPSARAGLVAADGQILETGSLRATAAYQYQYDPVEATFNGNRTSPIIDHRNTLAITAAWSPVKRLELGGEFSMLRQSYGRDAQLFFSDFEKFAIASPSAYARFGLYQGADTNLTVGLKAHFPITSTGSLASESKVAFTPTLFAGHNLSSLFRLTGSAGVVLRERLEIAGRAFGHQALAQLGLVTRGESLRFEVAALGAGNLNGSGQQLAVEAVGGARYNFRRANLDVFLLGGPGFGQVIGTPTFRVMSGVAFTPNFGRQNAVAPMTPAPRISTPFQAPIAKVVVDSDRDGVPDDQDQCAGVFGVVEEAGCPAKPLDSDKDTVADAEDNCPSEVGTVENHGCPAEKKQMVVIREDRIEIRQRVFFVTGKADLESKSLPLLDQVAQVLVSHPNLPVIEIAGHTDSRGKAMKNLSLSQARAETVLNYLVGRGVSPDRLAARGYGAERPLLKAASELAYAVNRRVEFNFSKNDSQHPDSEVSKIEVEQ